MVVELAQPGARRAVKLLGVPVKLSRTPGDATRAPGPELGQHTDEILAAAGYSRDELATLHASGEIAGAAETVPGSFISS